MKDGKLCFGLVGLGMGGETHARQIAKLQDGLLLAAYGRDETKVRDFARRFGVPNVYTRLEDLLADSEIDIVNVVTPNGLHREFAVAAADAGKHVVVEKPLEISLRRAQDIIDACQRNNVCLGVIFQMRFGEAAQRLKTALTAGKFGRIIAADAIDKEFRSPEYYANDYWRGTRALEGGGCLMTQSIHVIDLLQWLAGPVVSAFAKTRTARHAIEVEDLVAATLTFESGALGLLQSATSIYPAFKSRVEIHGTEGSAIINGEWDQTMLWAVRGDSETIDPNPGFTFGDQSDPRLMPEERHLIEFQDIVSAVRAGRPPLVTGREALRSLAIAMAVYRSAQLGTEVAISDLLVEDGIAPIW
jgi:UDP-N-acetyl-2-amino-2-deoxyglucuronate dehydrogenase